MSILNPFQLLELNVISAQDLAPVSRSMRTYAVAWVHPDRKLSTRVDTNGHVNPTWNDKFVFRVDEDFLHADTSAVMIEIYALHWFKDVHVGTVRILVGNLIPTRAPTSSSYHNHNNNLGMRFVALQVRRPSGRPQGILNIGVAILHSAMRSMPIYSQLSTSAVGYRELMGEEDPFHHSGMPGSNRNSQAVAPAGRELRRTKSDTSSMIASEIRAKEFRARPGKKAAGKSSSVVDATGSETATSGKRKKGKRRSKGSSEVSGAGGSEVGKGRKGKSGKSSSVVNDGNSEVAVFDDSPRGVKNGKIGKAGSITNGRSEVGLAYDDPDPPKKGKGGKMGEVARSVSNGNSEVGSYEDVEDQEFCYVPPKTFAEVKPTVKKPWVKAEASPAPAVTASPRVKPSPRFSLVDRSGGGGGGGSRAPYRATPKQQHQPPGKSPFQHGKFQAPYEYRTPRKTPLVAGRGTVFLTESELGPSPSEVAAAMAKQPVAVATAGDDGESSILGDWSVDESVEGLRSKLERWRTELPPVYDRGELSSYPSSGSRHVRRHTDGGAGSGLFSCFSNICGVECSIVCGGGGSGGSKKGGSERIVRSPSADNLNYK